MEQINLSNTNSSGTTGVNGTPGVSGVNGTPGISGSSSVAPLTHPNSSKASSLPTVKKNTVIIIAGGILIGLIVLAGLFGYLQGWLFQGNTSQVNPLTNNRTVVIPGFSVDKQAGVVVE